MPIVQDKATIFFGNDDPTKLQDYHLVVWGSLQEPAMKLDETLFQTNSVFQGTGIGRP